MRVAGSGGRRTNNHSSLIPVPRYAPGKTCCCVQPPEMKNTERVADRAVLSQRVVSSLDVREVCARISKVYICFMRVCAFSGESMVYSHVGKKVTVAIIRGENISIKNFLSLARLVSARSDVYRNNRFGIRVF